VIERAGPRRRVRAPIALGALGVALLALSGAPVLPERAAAVRRAIGAMSVDSFERAAAFGTFGAGDYAFGASRAAARELRRMAGPGHESRTRLFVWGFEPLLYLDAGLTPASRFIYNAPLASPWCPRNWIEEIVASLRADPPELVVVVREDAIPWVTGVPFDSRESLRHFPAIISLLKDHYAPAGEVEHFTFFRRSR
jgi:hypothetical protein